MPQKFKIGAVVYYRPADRVGTARPMAFHNKGLRRSTTHTTLKDQPNKKARHAACAPPQSVRSGNRQTLTIRRIARHGVARGARGEHQPKRSRSRWRPTSGLPLTMTRALEISVRHFRPSTRRSPGENKPIKSPVMTRCADSTLTFAQDREVPEPGIRRAYSRGDGLARVSAFRIASARRPKCSG
jgi:hypothetical protein